jgi:bifunctional non-homologous end joining protein LigD
MAPGATQATQVTIDGKRLRLTNPDKVLYPAAGFTKAQVVDYYARVAPVMLPHLAHRAVTMVRFPDGVEAESFFEKRCPKHRPEWVRTAPMAAGENGIACVIDDRPSLVWTANLAALELHVTQARVEDPDYPAAVVFDLDPGEPAGVLEAARVALDLRAMLEALELTVVVKTSGSKGLHLSVPIRPSVSADDTKAWALALGQVLAKRSADRVTVEMRRELRPGKVFVDWSQNDRHKTTVCAYSLRGRPQPTVSTPVEWREVEAALDAGDADALTFEAAQVLERIATGNDPYAANLRSEQELPALR